MKEENENRPSRSAGIRGFLPAILLTTAISFLITLYAPVELYVTNQSEFVFDIYLLLPQMLKLFVLMEVCGLIFFGICRLIRARLYSAMLTVGLIGLICTYIQGMYMAGNLPPLDGTTINWADYAGGHIASIILWVVVTALVLLLRHKAGPERSRKICCGVSVFLSLVLLVTGVTVCLQYDGMAHKHNAVVTKDEEFTFSTDQNLIILVTDTMDSWCFNGLLEDGGEDSECFPEILEDFTFFPDTMGAYPYTAESVPFILTGEWYENEEPFEDYVTRAMTTSPLLTTLRDDDYHMSVYFDGLDCGYDAVSDLDNVKDSKVSVTSFRDFAVTEMKLVWFKYAPYPLKPFANLDMQVFSYVVKVEQGELYTANNQNVYSDIQTVPVTLTEDRCFRYTHIEGAHVPYRYDRNVNLIDEEDGTYVQSVECTMTIVSAYLQKLKDAGVYDNSAIIIMSDHGQEYKRSTFECEDYCNYKGRTSPLFLVKGIGEDHPMAISEAPLSYEDLQEAYQRLLDGASAEDAFDAKAGDERSRRFLGYAYLDTAHMTEYYQEGNVWDLTKLIPSGKTFTYGED